MTKPELLAPAGSMECFRTALDFGADAVYVAGRSFGLRASAPNLTESELSAASDLAHARGRKLYVAVNALVRESEIRELEAYLRDLDAIAPDGIIFSDPAVLQIVRSQDLKLQLHLSTQTSTMNSAACAFWASNGVRRIVLAREATLSDISEMRRSLPDETELEVFAHGAMCIAHSGRCLLSSVATGRSGNRGECAQPCRWEYEIREKGTDDDWMQVAQDATGTFILNSKDLMMLDRIPELVRAGVSSLKIEGRMKSAYYVASVVHAYRRALDMYCAAGLRASQELFDELEKSSTRAYTRGFFFGNPGPDGQDTVRRSTPRRYTFAARVLQTEDSGLVRVEQRNKFSVGDVLEILEPDAEGRAFEVTSICTPEGEERRDAPHAQEILLLRCPYRLRGGEILRRQDEVAPVRAK